MVTTATTAEKKMYSGTCFFLSFLKGCQAQLAVKIEKKIIEARDEEDKRRKQQKAKREFKG